MTFNHERQIQALMAIYREAEARIAASVEQTLRSGQLGTATYRRNQLAQISGMIAQLESRATPQAVAILKAGYEDGQLVANLAGINSAFSGIHTEAVNMLADSLSSRLGQGFVNIGRQVEDVYRKEGLRLAALSIAEGSTRKAASSDLIDALVQQGITGFTDKTGRDWGLATYSDMVLRTTTREAVSEGTKNRLVEGGMDLVEWAGNGENCPECQALDGQVFSLTGQTDGYEVIEDMPPLHPNCTCVMIPATVTFEELERALDEEAPSGSAFRRGPEPPEDSPAGAMSEAGDGVSSAQEEISEQLTVTHPDLVIRTPPSGNDGWYDAKEQLIYIDPSLTADDAAFVYAEEFGHHLDQGLFGIRHPGRTELLNVLRNSDRVQALADELEGVDINYSDTRKRAMARDYMVYLLTDSELIARAVSQHLAARGGAVGRGFAKARAYSRGAGNSNKYWSDQEFGDIAVAVDKWLTMFRR